MVKEKFNMIFFCLLESIFIVSKGMLEVFKIDNRNGHVIDGHDVLIWWGRWREDG